MKIVTKKQEEARAKLMTSMVDSAVVKSRFLGQCLAVMREASAYIMRMPPHRPISLTKHPLSEAERDWRDLIAKLEALLLREHK